MCVINAQKNIIRGIEMNEKEELKFKQMIVRYEQSLIEEGFINS